VTARRPLAGLAADLARLDAEELPFLVQLDVRIGTGAATTLGFPLDAMGFPLEPNTTASTSWRDTLWLGPDEWLVVAESDQPELLAEQLEEELGRALARVHHSIVDVSAARAIFDLRGPARLERLAIACPLDLHPRSWGPGRCAQTVFGGAPVLLHERPDATRVFVRPSFASYVIALLDSPV
jgi:sarcosine oxidase, subunit gamma